MEKKIALEEHFMHPDFVDYWSNTAINISPELFGKVRNKLEDFGERRLNEMDSIGVEKSVLSLAGSGVQAEYFTNKAIVKIIKLINCIRTLYLINKFILLFLSSPDLAV